MDTYKGVPVPGQLVSNPDDIQAHWWQRGVRDSQQVTRANLEDAIEAVCETIEAIDDPDEQSERLDEAVRKLRDFRAGE